MSALSQRAPLSGALRVYAAGATDVGRLRTCNEDALGCFPALGLYLVVDGLGGISAGETAARLAVDSVQGHFAETKRDPQKPWPFKMDRQKTYEENRLIAGIRSANERIYVAARDDRRLRGIGATIAAVSIVDDRIHLAHVGECRVYLFRGRKLECLTEDHSLVNELLRTGQLKPEDAADFPHKNVITRALGMSPDLAVDTQACEVKEGDVYLLCTDGLWAMVEEPELAVMLREDIDPEEMAKALIERANARGGQDNIAAVVVRVER